MKTISIFFSLIFFLCILSHAGNIKIDKPGSITETDTLSKTAVISFDISWDNSWRESAGLTNYDGAWVFIKYRENKTAEWKHATISTSVSDFSIVTDNGTVPGFSVGKKENKGMGVFAFRKNAGTGTINWDGFKVKWQYGQDNLANISLAEVRVFALEMVYVPQGAFSLGSGGSEACAFYTYPNATSPYKISSENPVTVGQNTGNLFYAKHFYSEMFATLVPAEFPKGYNAFWCMKYEITQGQYADFLNTLSRQQQASRVIADISSLKVKNYYVMANDRSPAARNGIRCDTLISASDPVTFYCDLNANSKPNESNDGQSIACNYLGWADGAAFTDWAGLRPMTEFEFEKACRGTNATVAEEYAWGSTKIISAESILNSGNNSETASNTEANCMFDNPAKIQGPAKSGMYFKKTGTREQNGESFYGIADLSGNLFERCVTISNINGVAFKGSTGDGILDVSGNYSNSDWPIIWGAGAGYRGGSYFYGSSYCRISDRQYAGLSDNSRYYHYGFRAVRSAE